jgi:hypothetical protein
MIHGFDVSAYQGTSVPSADFIVVKATEGDGYTSSRFAAQWADAKRKGMVRGAYHFARPEESSGAAQADRLIATAKAVPGELLCLDLETSELNQARTNSWARAFGDRLRARAPGVTTVVYMGSAYASSGTGRGLADHFDLWWYPQYPSTGSTRSWPARFSPWLPGGITTGWDRPHIWQWTDNFAGAYDADISWLTRQQLAGSGRQEEDMPYGGQVPSRNNVPNRYAVCEFSFPTEFANAVGLVTDHTYENPDAGYAAQPPAQVRVTAHRKGRGGEVLMDPTTTSPTYGTEVITVGSDDGEGWPDKVVVRVQDPANIDYVTVVRLDDGDRPVGVDMS